MQNRDDIFAKNKYFSDDKHHIIRRFYLCMWNVFIVHRLYIFKTNAGRKTSKLASELLKYRCFAFRAMLPVAILTLTHQSTTTSSSLAAWIKVPPVLTNTRVLVKVLGRVLDRYSDKYSSRKLLVSGNPTRHTVMSSHGQLITCQLVTDASRHTVNSSQASTYQSKDS